MSNFPTSQDDSSTLPNPIAGNFTTAPDHAVLHSTENDAIKALEAKLGTGASTSTNNTFLIGNGTGTSAWSNLTSAQLAARVSDETGSGSLVFGTSPVITTPTGIIKGDVGLGNVDNTSDSTKNAAAVSLTNKTIITPTIASFVNATHTHQDSAGGGQLGYTAITTDSSWAWQTWTPTFSNWTIGTGGSAGTFARYIQIGKTVFYRIESVLGTSGQSVGTSPTFTLPVTAKGSLGPISGVEPIGNLFFICAGSSNQYVGQIWLRSSTTGGLIDQTSNTTFVQPTVPTATSPGTFASGDYFIASGTYEAT